jgi:SGNH domain (fused to AT3 domains)
MLSLLSSRLAGVVLSIAASGGAASPDLVRPSANVPACFAAAARDRDHPCSNPQLRNTVVPTPIEARTQRNSPCTTLEKRGLLFVCGFGTATAQATATVALIGDSHAAHWRAALDVVARANSWTGISLSHTGCPLSQATKNLPQPRRDECVRWNREVHEWLDQHQEITTVFVSQISGGVGVIARGRDQLAAQRAGYRAAWRALPQSVGRIVVLRDTPKAHGETDTCVQRAIDHHRRTDIACRVARRDALTQDSAASAAHALHSERVTVVDLTRFFCDRAWCHPVIGGALVLKDQTHMTETFSRSLGPYLQRAL